MILVSGLIVECFSDVIMLGGTCSRGTKFFLHYCVYGKAQTVWPVQRCKGRFLSSLFEQAVISWLPLLFITFWNLLWAVFPSWQEAPGYVIPCDTYIAHQDYGNMFWLPALLMVMSRSLAEAAGQARAWRLLLTQGTWAFPGPAKMNKRKDPGDGKDTAELGA